MISFNKRRFCLLQQKQIQHIIWSIKTWRMYPKAHRVYFKASLSALFIVRRTFIHASLRQRQQSHCPINIWHLLFKCNLTDKLSFNGFSTAQTIQASTHNFCGLTITLYLSPKWFRHWQNTLLRLNAHSSPQIDCCIAVNHRQPF